MNANPTNHFPALARPSSGEIPKVQPDAQGRASFAGGFSRTKKDAKNDAGIVWRQSDKVSDRRPN